MGGHISPPDDIWGNPSRVWRDAALTKGGLAMSRSIGDHLVGALGVTAEPEVLEFDVDVGKDLYVVIASDGVWEFIESEQAYFPQPKAYC